MKKYKVVYNACYGGFGLSMEAAQMLAEMGVKAAQNYLKEIKDSKFKYSFGPSLKELPRHDPRLIQVVEKLKGKANGDYAELGIAKINGNIYQIDEYDGFESVIEPEDQEWIAIPENE